MAESESSPKMKIVVKTPKDKKEIEMSNDGQVDELKKQVAEAFSVQTNQLCLIFAGKILKDGDSLEQHSIKDGHTVHLVIKSANRSSDAPAAAPSTPAAASTTSSTATTPTPAAPNIAQSPFGLGSMGGIPGMGEMGMGSSNFAEMQQRMQREMMSNPEMLSQMMNNPMVQSLMSNPDVMRQLVTSNPQMRELMERNPEITHMLNNPELMRQTMELARNPAMLQELMRSQDRAMSNLESIPGGFNALQRMYRDVQEPMMDAAQEGFGSNPFAALGGNRPAGTGEGQPGGPAQQGRENTEPLPNPWAAPGGGGATTAASSTTTSTSSTAPAPGGTTPAGMPAGMFNNPGMQSLMGQLQQNPQLMQNMLQAPYMQSMLQSLQANPELAGSMINSNPLFAGNPQMQDYMRTMMPTFLNQMQNPEMQSLMTNPRALQAMMQIQSGMQQLQQEAPTLAGSMGVPGMSMPNPVDIGAATTTASPSTTTTSSTTSSGDSTSTTTTAPSPTAATGTTPSPAAAPGGLPPQEQFSQFMSQMVNMMGTTNVSQSPSQAPEQRFASQLEQMAAMGFVDRQANIQALTATFGDVNAAIDRLLQQQMR